MKKISKNKRKNFFSLQTLKRVCSVEKLRTLTRCITEVLIFDSYKQRITYFHRLRHSCEIH